MRRVDAPRPGWYPDPEGRSSLRWWDGEDWADIRRAPPSQAELLTYEENQRFYRENELVASGRQTVDGLTRNDAQQIIAEVRNVARAEVDRAAQEFSHRATAAARSFTPLISEYTSKLVRWVKFIVVVATILLVGWFVFQVIFQASLFEWIGDRIDNLTDNQNGAGQHGAGVHGLGALVVSASSTAGS